MRVSNCTEFEQRLQESIETRATVDATAFCDHAANCDDCRRLWEEYLLLNQAVAEWKSELPVVDLADAVLAQHAFNESMANESRSSAAEPRCIEMAEIVNAAGLASRPRVILHSTIPGPAQMPSSRQRNGALAVLAAAALVLCLIGTSFNPTAFNPTAFNPTAFNPTAVLNQTSVDGQLADTPQTTTGVTSTQDIAEVDATQADVEALVRDAGSAYLALARDAANVFTDTVVLIPEQSLPRAVPADALDSNSNDSGRLVPWGQELDPIRRDVGHAIDFLFETISNDAEPAT